jgi:hypothetical protein
MKLDRVSRLSPTSTTGGDGTAGEPSWRATFARPPSVLGQAAWSRREPAHPMPLLTPTFAPVSEM